jgi:predicted nucleotidyltransferase
MEPKIASIIKQKVQQIVPNAKVLLFGSQARGNNTADSDYDLLIICDVELSPKQKIGYLSELNFELVRLLKKPFDILLNSQKEIEKKKQIPGHVVSWAIKEGVLL